LSHHSALESNYRLLVITNQSSATNQCEMDNTTC
jgi:hypothetical protein